MRADDDEDDDQELRTFVMVHDIKPPFLDGRLVLSKVTAPVVPVRDPTSDMAIIAKKGSQLMKVRTALHSALHGAFHRASHSASHGP